MGTVRTSVALGNALGRVFRCIKNLHLENSGPVDFELTLQLSSS